ncbi:predicted protein [Histoplasma capsulatum H143]|uniref:Uncharacterized protein n=1 Tax=Ajellomyces capsulatus (strain H143) TaxID=544712 RepID=C6HSU1_AJECH|nr:predicted protein [Histoplasma capsulatum H143]
MAIETLINEYPGCFQPSHKCWGCLDVVSERLSPNLSRQRQEHDSHSLNITQVRQRAPRLQSIPPHIPFPRFPNAQRTARCVSDAIQPLLAALNYPEEKLSLPFTSKATMRTS